MFITLTLILTNQEGGVIGRTVTKTWGAMTDCIILQFATARKGSSEHDSAQTPLLLEKRINKGQSRASSDSVAKESQHSSAGRGNSGRFNSDAIIMDRPNNTKGGRHTQSQGLPGSPGLVRCKGPRTPEKGAEGKGR